MSSSTLNRLFCTYSTKKLNLFAVLWPSTKSTVMQIKRFRNYLKWRYKVFNISRDLTNYVIEGSHNFMRWELFMVCHHLGKCGGHKYCTSRDIMFLVYHVIKQDHVNKGSAGYNKRSPPW